MSKRSSKSTPAVSRSWTAKQVLILRLSLGLNQNDFWSRVYITQSAGTRYESGRPIFKPVQAALTIAYETRAESHKEI